MEEPNLSVIKEISGNDIDFQNSILEIIKNEFPEEMSLFTENFSRNNFSEAANNVHKLKHKIGLLGLENGLKTATAFEKELKKGNTKLHHNFLEVLDKIHVYLY
jgi:HPt (histidine-containing phosphotransfer) domain-containing protein